MNRIQKCFSKTKDSEALVCFLVAGHPDFKTTAEIVIQIEQAGADMVELGIPFSDPMADGPTIQKAAFEALNNGATVEGVMECVKNIRADSEIPIVLMTYYNPVLHYGVEAFAKRAIDVGVDGIILTDLPADEAEEWIEICDSIGLATVFLVAPTSTDERIRQSAKSTSGFIYCVSRLGVTGARNVLDTGLKELVDRVKALSNKPVAVGFGISTAEQVQKVNEIADAAVVGSALVKIISESKCSQEAVSNAVEFVKQLKQR